MFSIKCFYIAWRISVLGFWRLCELEVKKGHPINFNRQSFKEMAKFSSSYLNKNMCYTVHTSLKTKVHTQ